MQHPSDIILIATTHRYWENTMDDNLKRFDTKLNEPTNLNSTKSLKSFQVNEEITLFKHLGF